MLKKEQTEIITEISNLEKDLDIYNKEQIEKYTHLKRKWDNFQNLKTQGSILRSKAKFVDFVYLGFNVAFNTVQVISRRVVGRAEETST